MRHRTNLSYKRIGITVTRRGFCALDSRGYKEIPPIQSERIVDLKLNGNPITTFQGLSLFPKLETLRCDNTQLVSFKGAIPQPMLHHLTYVNTPLSKYELHQEMAVVVFGDTLRFINNRELPRRFVRKALANRDRIYGFLIEGWILMSFGPQVLMYNPDTKTRKQMYIEDRATSIGRSLWAHLSLATRKLKPPPITENYVKSTGQARAASEAADEEDQVEGVSIPLQSEAKRDIADEESPPAKAVQEEEEESPNPIIGSVDAGTAPDVSVPSGRPPDEVVPDEKPPINHVPSGEQADETTSDEVVLDEPLLDEALPGATQEPAAGKSHVDAQMPPGPEDLGSTADFGELLMEDEQVLGHSEEQAAPVSGAPKEADETRTEMDSDLLGTPTDESLLSVPPDAGSGILRLPSDAVPAPKQPSLELLGLGMDGASSSGHLGLVVDAAVSKPPPLEGDTARDAGRAGDESGEGTTEEGTAEDAATPLDDDGEQVEAPDGGRGSKGPSRMLPNHGR
jgi:hypothetical protein